MNPLLDAVRSRHPEWSGWLDVVEIALRECGTGHGQFVSLPANVDVRAFPSIVAAIAAGVEPSQLAQWLGRLSRCAADSGLPGMQGFANSAFTPGDARELFDAESDADFERLAAFAERVHIDVEALRAVANLFVMPVMHACRETGAAREALRHWCEGYCACCGAWPAYAEICGIERERRLCCGRCGTTWPHDVLSCTYCGTRDHTQLSTLIVESQGPQRAIEVCSRCRGYLKQFRTLAPSVPLEVLIGDLGSVDLDVAAAERSYVRPRGVGRAGAVLPTD